MEEIPIIPVERLDLRFEPVAWRFAVERRDAIDAHFARLRVDKPAMFNGRVLLLRHGFPMAALRSSDGAFLLGVMGGHTATAGQVYFPAGTPDPNDVVGERVDLEAGVMRELLEETGLGPADATAQPGWFATPLGQRLALMKVVEARQDADTLRRRILKFLAADAQPELVDIEVVRSVDDLHSAMPRYVSTFLADRLRVP
jgi:8-oxo-dGTP pyrophosphatase MutT (NUDIX family)